MRVAARNVVAADGGTGGRGAFTVGFLQGDVDQTRAVTATDASLVKAAMGKPVTATNFLLDVNASGTINKTDQRLVSTGATHVLPAPPANRAPVANAGSAQSVAAGATVALDGNASSDPDGDALSFAWTLTSKPSGSGAALAGRDEREAVLHRGPGGRLRDHAGGQRWPPEQRARQRDDHSASHRQCAQGRRPVHAAGDLRRHPHRDRSARDPRLLGVDRCAICHARRFASRDRPGGSEPHRSRGR